MYCRYCGKEIPDDAKFCIYCGENMELDSSKVASDGSSQKSTTFEKKVDPSMNETDDHLSHLKKYNDIYSAFLKVDERINKREWEDAIVQIRNALEMMTLHLLKEYKSQDDINTYLKSIGKLGGAGTYIRILKDALIIDQESVNNLFDVNDQSKETHHASDQTHEYTESDAKKLYGTLLKESKKFTSVYLQDISEENKHNLDFLFERAMQEDIKYDTPQNESTYSVIDYIRIFFNCFLIACAIVIFTLILTDFFYHLF